MRFPCLQCVDSWAYPGLASSAFRRAGGICEIVSDLLKVQIPIALLSALSRLIVLAYKNLISATKLHIAPRGQQLTLHPSQDDSKCVNTMNALGTAPALLIFDCMQGGTALHQERSTGSSLRQARPLHVPGTLPLSCNDALTSQSP